MKVPGRLNILDLGSLFYSNWCIVRMNRRKAEFKFVYKYLEDDL